MAKPLHVSSTKTLLSDTKPCLSQIKYNLYHIKKESKMKILVKTKKVIRTISKLLNELYDSKSEVRIRIDSYEAIINSDGKIIGSKSYGAPTK